MLRRRPPSRRGFTLIEVLAALAIFLISLAAIFQLVDYGTRMAVEAADVTVGNRLAQSKMAEVEAGLISASEGATGTFDQEPGWAWEVTSTPATAPSVYEVTVTCHIDAGHHVTVQLTQLIFDPQYNGTASPAVPPTTTTGTGQ